MTQTEYINQLQGLSDKQLIKKVTRLGGFITSLEPDHEEYEQILDTTQDTLIDNFKDDIDADFDVSILRDPKKFKAYINRFILNLNDYISNYDHENYILNVQAIHEYAQGKDLETFFILEPLDDFLDTGIWGSFNAGINASDSAGISIGVTKLYPEEIKEKLKQNPILTKQQPKEIKNLLFPEDEYPHYYL